jgi:1-acyl-sn-glycerol-3-phosphate acyltransferase
MLCTGIILVPLRLVGTILTLSLGWVWAKIALLGLESDDRSSKPYSKTRHKIIFAGFRIVARILLFCFGYIWIKTVKHSASNHKTKQKEANPIPKVVVCNHTGFVELLYLAYYHGCSLVSKETNKHLPFMGLITQALQCIFVDRTKGGANNTSQKIRERLEAEPGQWPLLAVAPEGTTTNGHTLIHFHTGAFRPGQPVLPIATEMPFSPIWGYDPSFSCANMNLHILGLMSQPWNRLTVHELPVYVPSEAEKIDVQLFANNVRQEIADVLNIPIYELQWRDKLPYEPSTKKQKLGNKFLMDKNNDVSPSVPVFTQDVFGNMLTGNG